VRVQCLAIHPARRIVASGQVASTAGCPYVCLWDTHEKVDKDGTPVLKGLLQRIPLEGTPRPNRENLRSVIIAPQVSSRADVPQKLTGLISLCTNPVSILSVPI
jgi:hypothetical protein